ncbi:MAG: GntR family transcriptional regulator, partial [Rhodoferax sp.]
MIELFLPIFRACMALPRISVSRLSDSVAAELEQRILEGSLKPGDRLPPERSLAQDLG